MNTTDPNLMEPKAVSEAASPRCEATPQTRVSLEDHAKALATIRQADEIHAVDILINDQDHDYNTGPVYCSVHSKYEALLIGNAVQVTAQRDELLAAFQTFIFNFERVTLQNIDGSFTFLGEEQLIIAKAAINKADQH